VISGVNNLFMSLIHTCELSSANPLDYLNGAAEALTELIAKPPASMPWNYSETLAELEYDNPGWPERIDCGQTERHSKRPGKRRLKTQNCMGFWPGFGPEKTRLSGTRCLRRIHL
jgi:hypothetical protein